MNTPQSIGNIDPAQLRANQAAKEEEKRFDEISDKVIQVFIANNLTMEEISRVVSSVTTKVNKKINGARVENVLAL